jgi:hypothetical protein
MNIAIAIVTLLLTPALGLAWPATANPPTATVLTAARAPLYLCLADNAADPVCGQDLTVKVGDVVSIGVSTSKTGVAGPFPAQVMIVTSGAPQHSAPVAANGLAIAVIADSTKAWTIQAMALPPFRPGSVQYLPTPPQTVTVQ